MPACDGISNQIELLEEERQSILSELQNAPSSLKSVLLRELRLINVELGRLRQQLRMCQEQTPPVARPDLVAQTVQLHVNHSAKTLGVAAVVKNIGQGAAFGPFRIDLAVTMYRGGFTTSFVQVFEVPAGFVLYGELVISPGFALAANGQAADGQQTAGAQQAAAAQQAAMIGFPGGGLPPILTQEYITDDMVVPLHYRDENPSTFYEFEFLVDSEKQVQESNETNNHFVSGHWWTTNPQALQRGKPFIVEMRDGEAEKMQTYKEGSKVTAPKETVG